MQKSLLGLALAAGLVLGAASPALAQSSFDGNWSVLFVVTGGDCPREAYRYSIGIEGGTVRYRPDAGGPSIQISGRVSANGAVNVSARYGDQRADDRGHHVALRLMKECCRFQLANASPSVNNERLGMRALISGEGISPILWW